MAKVLIIDDDVDLIEMNKAVLAKRGHSVLAAFSAADARKLLKHGAPDIAVIDVMMESDSAGFELAREIHQSLPKLPMLILSGVHEAKELPFRFEPDETYLPVVKFLDKPLAPAALADEVYAALGKGGKKK